jgi:hypothetical protein
MVDSDTRVLGDHWRQWLGSHCPALLLHGTAGTVLPTAHAHAHAAQRTAHRLSRLVPAPQDLGGSRPSG